MRESLPSMGLRRLVLFLSLICLVLSPVTASSQEVPGAQALIPAPPELNATSWLLMDADTGEVLVEHNADEALPPASLTKLMTAYLVEHELNQGNLSLDDQVSVSENAWRTGGSRMFIQEGSNVALEELLRGIIIASGNDASVAVAEHIAGSESSFADLMNQQAERLDMDNTHFVNSTGLPDPDHYSSARDLAKLSRHIIEDYPEHYAIYAEREFTYNDIRQSNRNRLLWRDSSYDGLKTGHTEAAGYCLVASAERDDMRLISVVMGTESENARAEETQRLMSYGFRFFETTTLYDAGEELDSPRVWGGEADHLSVGVDEEVRLTLPRGSNDELSASLNMPESIDVPVAQGDRIGTLEITLADEVVKEVPLVALEDLDEGSFFKRMMDIIKRFVTGFFD
ncbi:D-alanyl-D-alanine carboxypeptidase family protein [Aidingimonas halophila]|uniref:serine-type D-Ala-D-Ala carboxypeptidase n=1 Tax=Aidingimonas halophila TaxID=574349 RepID=A0A1H3AZ42_9GAMM|nr:D-alanyl-D-alanine carboxypeptidase family protein [Aidingimonas halophila]GHC25587.1 D-Ala-D-Ala carboxypeptidase [Aidingimonas halophila]SDX34671.1 D-alanyl-D-alanine carboxypeptidase (penicillin-binding protein 5/6) [Aidingimonas halophila]